MLKTFKIFLPVLLLSLTTKTCRCKQETKLDEVNNKPIKIIPTQPSTHSNLKAQQNGRSKSSTSTTYNPVEITANNPPNGIRNINLMCYMNANFQILASVFLDDIKNVKETPQNKTLKTDLVEFLEKINNPNVKILEQDIEKIKGTLNEFNITTKPNDFPNVFFCSLHSKLHFLPDPLKVENDFLDLCIENDGYKICDKTFTNFYKICKHTTTPLNRGATRSNKNALPRNLIFQTYTVSYYNDTLNLTETIDVTPSNCNTIDTPEIFTLVGVIYAPYQGHYAAFVKRRGKWYDTNDTVVHEVSIIEVLSKINNNNGKNGKNFPVIVFYKKN